MTDSGLYFRNKNFLGSVEWDKLKENDIEKTTFGIKVLGEKLLTLASAEEDKLILFVLNSIIRNYDFKAVEEFAVEISQILAAKLIKQ